MFPPRGHLLGGGGFYGITRTIEHQLKLEYIFSNTQRYKVMEIHHITEIFSPYTEWQNDLDMLGTLRVMSGLKSRPVCDPPFQAVRSFLHWLVVLDPIILQLRPSCQ